MKYVRLGKTDLTVSKTAIGTVPIQRLSRGDAVKLMRSAFDGGINFFDTADNYEKSEEKLGYAFESNRHDIVISSKVSVTKYDDAMTHLTNSLRDLKTDYIDIMQLHNPKNVPDGALKDDALAALRDAKEKGYIRHIGYTSHDLQRATESVTGGNFETLQYPLNNLSGEKDDELLGLCAKNDVGVIAMKPFAGGMIRMPELPFLYFRSKENVVPIYGVQRQSELDALLEMENSDFEMDKFWEIRMEEYRKNYRKLFCRGCDRCLSACPQGIRPGYMGRIGDFLYRNAPPKYLSETWHKQVQDIPKCTGCGSCVAACPFGCDLREKMKESYDVFMSFWNEREKYEESAKA